MVCMSREDEKMEHERMVQDDYRDFVAYTKLGISGKKENFNLFVHFLHDMDHKMRYRDTTYENGRDFESKGDRQKYVEFMACAERPTFLSCLKDKYHEEFKRLVGELDEETRRELMLSIEQFLPTQGLA